MSTPNSARWTDTVKTDMYRFFNVAFNAAPGVTYMAQLYNAVVNDGLSTQQVVEAFTTKSQFTDIYPVFITNKDFADKIVENVVGSSADVSAKQEASSQIQSALNGGATRGQVIYAVFNNLANMPSNDLQWGATAQRFQNQVNVAKYYTETLKLGGEDPAPLRAVIAQVDQSTNTSTTAALQAVYNSAFPAETFSVTADAPSVIEGNSGTKTLTFIVTLDKAPTEAVVVNYQTVAGGTATVGDDCNATAGAITFAAGQTAAAVSVTVNGDTAFEAD